MRRFKHQFKHFTNFQYNKHSENQMRTSIASDLNHLINQFDSRQSV